MGPVIDNVLEPKYKALAAEAGSKSAEFKAIQKIC
jgi:hypothetical protein